MLVTASAQDSKGAVASTTFEAKPTLRTLAVTSQVPVTINGDTASSASVVAGSDVQLNAPLTSAYWHVPGLERRRRCSALDHHARLNRTLSAAYTTAISKKYAALGGIHPSWVRRVRHGVRHGRGTRPQLRRWSHLLEREHRRPPVNGGDPEPLPGGGRPVEPRLPDHRLAHAAGGRASYFTGGRIYWSSSTGAHALSGAILTKYLAAGGPTATVSRRATW